MGRPSKNGSAQSAVQSLLCSSECKSGEEESEECEPVVVLEGFGQTFVIAGQAAEAARPSKGFLNNPSFRQQH